MILGVGNLTEERCTDFMFSFSTVRHLGKIVRRFLLDFSEIKLNAPEKFYTDFRRVANPLSSVRDETCELSDRQYTQVHSKSNKRSCVAFHSKDKNYSKYPWLKNRKRS